MIKVPLTASGGEVILETVLKANHHREERRGNTPREAGLSCRCVKSRMDPAGRDFLIFMKIIIMGIIL